MTPETLEILKNNPKKGDIVMKTFVDVLVEKGERNGMRKGRREGRKQEALAIAKRLKAKGMGVDDVADATGLTVDDVLRL